MFYYIYVRKYIHAYTINTLNVASNTAILFLGNNHAVNIIVIQYYYCTINIIVVLTDIPSDFVQLMVLYHKMSSYCRKQCHKNLENVEVIFVHAYVC